MDHAKTPLIPQKHHQERSRPRKQEHAADVSLPPLTPFPNHRPRTKTTWSSSSPNPHPLGSQDCSQKRRPYKVLHIGATPLMHACQQADRPRVLKLLKDQSDTIGYRDRTLRSALHYCMDAGTGGAVASAAPELVNQPDAEGHTPLHLAVIAGDTQLVAILLANGADVNAKDLECHSVLHWATVCGEAECVRLVLAAGARPSTPDLRGGSPLHYAAQCCGAAATAELSVPKKVGLKVLQTLLEFGANVNAKDEDGRQPILWAASAGSVEAVLALTRAGGAAAAGASDKDGLTALHCAASRGHARCVEALVNLCGSQPDHVDDNGCSALHYAATLGHADATALLLRLGADPNRQDRKGRTPALCAAAKGQLETLKILATHGGSLHARTVRGTGVAHEAVASGCVELIKWLVKKRPSLLDIATQDGKTPLHVAALHGHLDLCKVLLDNGARINAVLRTSKGSLMTALDAALYRGHRDCAKLIQMHGGSTAQQLRTHKTAPSKVFSAKLRVKCADSSTESDSSPHRKSRRHLDPDLYYEERWIERRTRRRKGSLRRLARQDSRSFSEEELRLSKSHAKKDQQRRALSESARYNDEESEDEEEASSRKKKGRRHLKRSKHEYSESWTESESLDDEVLKSSRKSKEDLSSRSVKKKNHENDPGDAPSLSDDSLEVVIVKQSIEKKSEKVVSGKRSKTPKESFEDTKVIKSCRKSSRKPKAKSKEQPEIRKKKSVEIDEASVRETKNSLEKGKLREEKDVDDSTSQDTIERVTVTAMVHKDQAPDTPKVKEDLEEKSKTDRILEEADEMQKELVEMATDIKTVDSKKEDAEKKETLEKKDTVENKDTLEKEDNLEKEANDKDEGKDSSEKGSEEISHSETDSKTSPESQDSKDDKNSNLDNTSKEESSEKKDHKSKDEVHLKAEDSETKGIHEESSKEESTLKKESSIEDEAITKSETQRRPSKKSTKKSDRDESEGKKEKKKDSIKDKAESRKDARKRFDAGKETPDQSSQSPTKGEGNFYKENIQSSTERSSKDQPDVDSARGKSEDASSCPESPDSTKEPENPETKSVESEKGRSKKDQENRVTIGASESFRFIDESSSSSPRSSKLAERSRPSTAKSKKSPLKSGVKKTTFFDETSEDRNSEDQSAIVAVFENPAWEEEEEEIDKEIRKAIGEDGQQDTELDDDDGVGIMRVLPSTSEEETPRNLGLVIPKRPDTDSLHQVHRKPQVRLARSESPIEERKGRVRLKQRRDSGGRDSGIEPSPRVSRIPRRNIKRCPNTEKQQTVNMESVTRDVQVSLRRYYLERKIFFQLMDLKRLQIRHGKANEHVLVKRQVESFNKAGMTGPTLGVVKYEKPLTFRDFESFLYDQLRRLQKRPGTPDWCTDAKHCTQKTHRCHHATSAYTSVPIYTYRGGDARRRKKGDRSTG
ncbi:inversin isoform X2 [Belonocnema kinseyi]|uniref:inversin isoform X2 n=1 Tax=Belonocnema kinseyi TaxID=2817044 RepID=UPI00143DD6D1|nr:inversin isoform X2 [Belonocnema kinseyi]